MGARTDQTAHEIDLPVWFRAICGLVAAWLLFYIARAWWNGSTTLFRFTAQHQAYVSGTSTDVTLTGPLELAAATLLLGGIAAFLGQIAVRPALVLHLQFIAIPVCMLLGGAILLYPVLG